jgi:PIN domain nuclease of toxin-antitoxin system
MPITIEAILLSSELRQKHGHPFDRLLYAQSRASKCVLLSIDRTLATFGSRVLSPE